MNTTKSTALIFHTPRGVDSSLFKSSPLIGMDQVPLICMDGASYLYGCFILLV